MRFGEEIDAQRPSWHSTMLQVAPIQSSSSIRNAFSKYDPISIPGIKVSQTQIHKYPKVTANSSVTLQNAKRHQEVDTIN